MRKEPALNGEADRPSELWNKFREGDREAFAYLYQGFSQPLFIYGLRVCNNETQVQDALQDLFIELWKSKENLDDVRDVKSYLFKSLRYKLIRQGKLNILYKSDDLMETFGDSEDSVEVSILRNEESRELSAKIGDAIELLSLRQQEAISLKFYHGFTNEQIGLIMGVNYQSATNILHRAILSLRKYFTSTIVVGLLSFFSTPLFF